jgi:hypothetical protein
VQQINNTKKRFRNLSLTKTTSWALLILGAVALAGSIIFTSSIPAFIGLGLVFWGIILLYIAPEEYSKTILLTTTTIALLSDVGRIIKDGKYEGKAVYLPPRYLKDFESSKVYLTTEKTDKLPSPAEIQQKETQPIFSDPNSILISPPGAELTRLFEKTLGTSFTKVDLHYVESNLPKLFIEDFEIAENTQITTENNKIHVKMENTVYKDAAEELRKHAFVLDLLGCPISSAVACILAKATGKPVVIEKYQISQDGRTVNVEYHLLEEQV